MRKKIQKLLLLSIIVMGTSTLSIAQQQDTLKSLFLKEVIVPATSTTNNISSVGRNITVISSEYIKHYFSNNS